jgi:hypothetical protein
VITEIGDPTSIPGLLFLFGPSPIRVTSRNPPG